MGSSIRIAAGVAAVACAVSSGAGAQTEGSSMILFLHHSTGGVVWEGGVAAWLDQYNATHGTAHRAVEQAFPKSAPYGWANYPYDYWNIWVEHAGPDSFQDEPTLEILTRQYDTIVFKHCYPVSNVAEDSGSPRIDSDARRLENYLLQYEALKAKLRAFPQTRFIVWTGAALAEGNTTEDAARRARRFFEWVRDEWDEPRDNIFVWDFYELETEGGLYLKAEYAAGPGDSHPSGEFAGRVAPLFGQRIVDVVEGRGDGGSVTGAASAAVGQSWGAAKRDATRRGGAD
ncbi:MAG: hypothetical protein ABIL09_26490 [Gemmatimonadota bacterium]